MLFEPLDPEKLCPNRFFQLWIIGHRWTALMRKALRDRPVVR
jgi:hypothetical protein